MKWEIGNSGVLIPSVKIIFLKIYLKTRFLLLKGADYEIKLQGLLLFL